MRSSIQLKKSDAGHQRVRPYIMAMAAVLSFAAFAGIDAVNYDSTREIAVLTLSDVAVASQIYVCRATEDLGSNPSDWPEARCVKEVAAGSTSAEVELPIAWRASEGVVRFVLVDRLAWHPLEYIHTSGNAWIDTGVVPDATTTISMKFRVGQSNNMPLFGVSTYFYCFDNGKNTFYGFFGAGAGGEFERHTADQADHTMTFGPGGVEIDGMPKTGALVATTTMPTASTLTLFGRRNYDTGSVSGTCNDDARIYWVNVEEGDERVRTFVPCLKDGKAALYDKVKGAFYLAQTQKGSKQLDAGPTDFQQLVVQGVSDALMMTPEKRQIVLAVYNPTTHCVDATISDGNRTKALYAAYDSVDRGKNLRDWKVVRQVATLPGGVTQMSVPIPEDWRNSPGRLRLFLGPRDLVSGRRVHALRSTGTQYIDSGIIPDLKTTTRITYQLLSKTWASQSFNPPFGISGGYFCYENSQGTYWCFFGNNQNFKSHAMDLAVHALEFGPGGAFIDQVLKADVEPGDSPEPLTQTMPFFGRRTAGTETILMNSQMRIYSACVERDGAVIGNFVPALDENGKGGFYNQVTRIFHPNKGIGDFEFLEDLTVDAEYSPELMEDVSPFVILGGPEVAVTIEGRTLTVAVDESAEAGCLFVACAPTDAGEQPSKWTSVAYLGSLSAGGGSFTYPLPSGREWRASGTVLRAFLSKTDRPYTRVFEYLHTAGSTWIDTGVVPDATTTISMKFRVGQSNNMPLFGVSTYYYCFDNGVNTFYGFFGPAGQFERHTADQADHTMTFGPGGVEIDGMPKTGAFVATTTMPTARTMTLFGRCNYDKGSANGYCNNDARIYWANIDKGGDRVRTFVPCEALNGQPGLYDRVSGVIYFNVNNIGGFDLGGASTTDPLLADFEALSVSQPIVVPKTGLLLLVH